MQYKRSDRLALEIQRALADIIRSAAAAADVTVNRYQAECRHLTDSAPLTKNSSSIQTSGWQKLQKSLWQKTIINN